MTSRAFRAAFLQLVPEFERATQNRIVMISGASLGNGPTTIPGRWARGELADVVTLTDDALAELLKRGKVVPDSRVQLVRLAPPPLAWYLAISHHHPRHRYGTHPHHRR